MTGSFWWRVALASLVFASALAMSGCGLDAVRL